MTNFQKITTGICILAGIVVILAWSESHDKKIMQAAEKYEACVRLEFKMSPAEYYAEKGEYPECK